MKQCFVRKACYGLDWVLSSSDLSHSGKAILLSTHDIAPAMELATHVLAVDPAARTILSGTQEAMIARGDIHKPFSARGMKFDPKVNDFR